MALLDKPASLHTLIPTPDKKSSTGHVWAYHKIQRILASPTLRRVFDPDANQFKLNAQRVVIAHLDRSDLEEFDALLLGLLLIGQYHGQVCIPDLGFYGRDAHTRLIRQKRLRGQVNYLDELPPQLRRAVLSVKDIAELEGRRDRIAEDLDEPLSRDSSERAIEMEDDQSLAGQAVLITREIASVKRALTRIENGTYGECVRCGAKIARKRLEARPEAALCFPCASKEH